MKIFWNLCFWMIWFWQWCIQRLSDAGILAWVPKLCAQIKGKVIQNNVTYLIISSMQMHLHVLRHFRVCYSKMLKKNFFLWPFFYGWGSTASRLQPLRGGSLLFTIQFPEIPGTHFIDLGRMKDWVNLGATQWFRTRDPWIGNPAP